MTALAAILADCLVGIITTGAGFAIGVLGALSTLGEGGESVLSPPASLVQSSEAAGALLQGQGEPGEEEG